MAKDVRPRLTRRQRQVIQLLAEGHSRAEIGDILDISYHTARFHIRKAFAALEATTAPQAVARAIREGLV